MARTACVDLPAFPLQLLLQRKPEWRGLPAAVVNRDAANGTLLWINEEARAEGCLPGMRYAAGLSLTRELRAGVVSEAEIEREIAAAADSLRTLTPFVEPSRGEPGVFWLSAVGLELLHPTLVEWAFRLRALLGDQGFTSRVAVGFSRFASYALAKAGPPTALVPVSEEEETRALREVPLDRLGLEPRVRDVLAKLGVHHLGGFLDLPIEEVRRRLPLEAAELHDQAHGVRARELHPERPLAPLERRIVLDHAESDCGRLVNGIDLLLFELLAELERRGEGVAALWVSLVLDSTSSPSRKARGAAGNSAAGSSAPGSNARESKPRTVRERLQPAAPTRDREQLLELVRLRLESVQLPVGVIEIVLDAEAVRLSGEQLEAFRERARRDRLAAERALAAVRAELGEQSVLRAEPREVHLPEARFRWTPITHLPMPEPRRIHHPPLVRRLYTRPIALAPREPHEPGGWLILGHEAGPVEESVGPYLLAGGWWKRAVTRQYYFARVASERWLWIYYDRERRRWFWQGEVG